MSARFAKAPTAALLTSTCRPSKFVTAASTAPLAGRRVTQVARERARATALGLDLFDERVEIARGAGHGGDPGPRPRERERERPADAPAGAGDESGSAADLHPGEEYRRAGFGRGKLEESGGRGPIVG